MTNPDGLSTFVVLDTPRRYRLERERCLVKVAGIAEMQDVSVLVVAFISVLAAANIVACYHMLACRMLAGVSVTVCLPPPTDAVRCCQEVSVLAASAKR